MQITIEFKCIDDWSLTFQAKLRNIKKSREGVSGAIWRQIATVVKLYVQQTDSRRLHLAELKRLDAESAAEIAKNQDRISREEQLIKFLKSEEYSLLSDRQLKIKNLEAEVENLNKNFLRIRKNLQSDLQTDERKLTLLIDMSYKTFQYLDKLANRGEQIKNLANTCKKFETQREKVAKWLPICDVTDELEKYNGVVSEGSSGLGDMKDKIKIISDHLKDNEVVDDSTDIIDEDVLPVLKYLGDDLIATKSKIRPRTAVSGRIIKSAQTVIDTPTPESRKITTVKNVVLQAKNSQEKRSSSISPPTSSSSEASTSSVDIIERCFESLKDMENFWVMFNKVEVDFMEVREEKKMLEKENKQLRGMIRAVLESAALSQSIPNSKVSTRIPSKRRSAYSAPIRRVLFS
ncbi:hypothetical protein NQ314_017441 [Rhamnusium bicolor]|uniref:Uncharacterized protein n=1 Tax=Rhamnusium bicolor TaxID=1586634 RepID=A0AAV8WTW2_9CUCU|nr:hypothetical protein NQ314_017441 [Rhamnusium bicolor]